MGIDKTKFPMARDEKEELFQKVNSKGRRKQKIVANPVYMQNLDNYLESENESRKILINNLNSNMKNI